MNDPLFTHFLKSNGVKIGDLIWGTWINLYTDVLTKTDWLLLFDHLVAYPEYPEIFILLVVAELLLKSAHITRLSSPEHVTHVLGQFKIDNVKIALARTIDLLASAKRDSLVEYSYKRSIPLHKGNYQPFTFIPKSLL